MSTAVIPSPIKNAWVYMPRAVPARVLNKPLLPPVRELFITRVKLAPGDSATGSNAGIKPKMFTSIDSG
jgi:hypothetical protein